MALIYLFPETDVLVGERVEAHGASGYFDCIDDPLGQVDVDDYLAFVANAQDSTGQVVLGCTPPPPVVSVNSVTLHYHVRRDTGSGHGMTVGFRVGGTPYYGSVFSPPLTWQWRQHGPRDKNPHTNAPWTQQDLDSLEITFEGWDDSVPYSSCFLAAAYAVVDAVVVPRAVGAARDRASRGLRLQGRFVPRITAPLEYAAWPLLSPLALSHFAIGPTGASPRRRDRRLCLLTGRSLDLDDALRVTLTATELRRVTAAEVDTCYSPDDEVSPAADGVMRLALGGRTFARASKKWVPSPVDRRIVQLLEDTEPLSAEGYLVNGARANAIIHSSLVNGISGLGFEGVGTNGSSITLDTSTLWCDPVVTPHSHKLVAGTPHTADLAEQFPVTAAFARNTSVCVSIAHLDASAAAPLYFALRRGVDNLWWPGSNGPAWSAARLWWPLPPAVGEYRYDLAARVDVGSAGTTFTLLVGIPTTGVAGQENWRAHAQIEPGRYPSGPVVTNGSAYTRQADQLKLRNDHGRRTWPLLHGSGQVRVRPLGWIDSLLEAGEERVLVDATLDAANGHVLLYRQGVGWVLRRRIAGVNYEAVAPTLITSLKEYSVGWRWTGPEGELGLAPYTLSVVVDGVRGTDAVAPGYHRPAPSAAELRIGHAAGPAQVADMAFLYREITPVVLDDDELMDF